MKQYLGILCGIFLLLSNVRGGNQFIANDAVQKKEITPEFKINAFSKVKEHSADVFLLIEGLQNVDSIQLLYNTKIDAKHKRSDWNVLKFQGSSIHIEDLKDAENYVYKFKIFSQDQSHVSDKFSFKTKRAFGYIQLLIIIGALGMFIFGMKMMSEGLQLMAGNQLRSLLGSITNNRVKGVLTGFSITGMVQSSSVTTVMTVSLVNAGLLTLTQSAGVMMGANIGTTITGWLVSLFGFKVSLSAYALIIIAFGAPFLFIKRGKARAYAYAIIGFAILFMGLGELKEAMPNLDKDSALVQFAIGFKDSAFLGPLIFVLIGTLVTVIIQSSSAAMALTLTLVNGVEEFPVTLAAAMILGENIGTTITAELASMVANVHAKRSARIHSLFNIIGVGWMLFLIPFFVPFLQNLMSSVLGEQPDNTTTLAMFHTAFNALNVLALIWFAPKLVEWSIKSVKSKGDQDEAFHLSYLNTTISSAELALLEAKKELAKFGEITARMNQMVQKLLLSKDKKESEKLFEKIQKYEEITDRIEVEVANFLTKVNARSISNDSSVLLRSMLSIANDLERIGDIYYQQALEIKRKQEQKIWFVQTQRDQLVKMYGIIHDAFDLMKKHLDGEYDEIDMQVAYQKEHDINAYRDKLKKEYLESIQSGEYHIEGGIIFANLYSSLEKVGDHIINVNEAIDGQI